MFERRQASLIAEHATLAGLEAKEAALGEQLRSARESLARLEQGIEARHGRTAEIARLERDLELDRAKQRRYTESLDQARIDQRLEERKISNIGIVQAASVPLQPVGPRRTLMLAVAVLVALFLSAGVALFSEYLDESISSPERVRLVLEVPTLASVPTLRSFRKSERLDRAYADYRDLLLLRAARSPHRPIVVALVATRTGAGTSTVAASLAESLARNADTPVLLVDADFRDAALTRAFGQNDQPGLSDLLRQSSSSGRIQYPRISSNLYLLAAGTVRSALGSLVSAEDFRSRLGASYAWSHVIIDLPAVSETRAAIALAASCDGVAIVVNSRRSRHSDELGLKNALVASGAAVDGVILNQHESPLRPLVEPPLAVVIS
jgi:Mrp family chromosome partitioning ATPase